MPKPTVPSVVADPLVRSLLIERLAADAGLRQVLPLFGIPVPQPAPADSERLGPDAETPSANGEGPDLHADQMATYHAASQIEGELRRVHELLVRVADALGACRSCLGTEPDCRYCGGTGSPGSRPVDDDLRRWLVGRLDPAAGLQAPRDPRSNPHSGTGR
jgi:hypothetical protein